MFEYFYHEILRRTVISFGTLFNSISIQHKDSNGNVSSMINVPLAYGPTQKFLARLEQSPDLNKPIQVTLPRMSFEFVGLNYDASRKVTTTQTFITSNIDDKTEVKKVYMPVPYNMQFELGIYTKLNDDMLQIIEQILPYFQPSYNLTVDLVDQIGEKRDIPIIIENISMSDDYEGDFTTRRALIYTIRFTAKTYLFGPVSSSATKDIIKKVSIGYVSGDTTKNPTRDLTYSVEPRAIKNYTNIVTTNLTSDIGLDTTNILVNDASNISENTYIIINNEEMYVDKKTNNNLVVKRGADGTTITSHVSGSAVKKITSTDNSLIEIGDDFGFSGTL
jgi:T4-like virus Myoviridae tail sheath stabiliser